MYSHAKARFLARKSAGIGDSARKPWTAGWRVNKSLDPSDWKNCPSYTNGFSRHMTNLSFPDCFALNRDVSAVANRASRVDPWSGNNATPWDIVHGPTDFPPYRMTSFFTVERSDSATSANDSSVASGRIIANSSPPKRQTISAICTCSNRKFAIFRNTRSPAACPKRSL